MNGAGAEVRREKHKTPQGSLSPSAEVASFTPTVSVFGNEQASTGNAALAGAAVGAYRERTAPPLLLQKAYGNAAVGYAATRSPALTAPTAEIAPTRSQEGEEFEELAPADKKAALAPKKDPPMRRLGSRQRRSRTPRRKSQHCRAVARTRERPHAHARKPKPNRKHEAVRLECPVCRLLPLRPMYT